MGSIQLFPGRGPVTIADVWRIAPLPAGGVRVRAARLEDYAAVRALECHAIAHAPPLTLRQFESRRQVFPEGQWVAERDGAIAGAGSSMVVSWERYPVDPAWKTLTGDGTFLTHDPDGRTLFAFDVVGESTRRGFGVGRALHLARRRLCRRLNLRRVAAALPLPGYGAVADSLTPELYAKRAIWGEVEEPALRFHLAQGFQYCGILHGFRPEDEDSRGHAALVAWLNPLYAPPGPSARAESQRARKCA